jgi:beta-lactamase superfamily II metal-dependent hydrolase
MPSSSRRATLASLAALLLLAGTAVHADVTIHCLDVGQGDATLIVSSSGQCLLFDGGDNGKGSGVVVPYMNTLGIPVLDYMACSHYHADHIGGLDEVYQARGVINAVYDRGWSYTTATYNSYANTVSALRTTITDGQVIDLGDGVTVTCVAVNGNGRLSPPFDDEENDYCLALLVECGDFDFFVAGDLSGINNSNYTDIESSVAPEVGEIEVYQVDHHGSYSASNATFLATTQPEVAVISVGNNSYGHPHQEVLNRLVAYGAHVYQTEPGSGGTLPAQDLTIANGHVVITTDGYGAYTVNGDVWAMDEDDLSDVASAGRFLILGNHPNPFNPATRIIFTSPQGGPARLTIYDLAGRMIYGRDFTAGAGEQSVPWRGIDGSGAPAAAGIYLYQLQTPGGGGSGRMTLVK